MKENKFELVYRQRVSFGSSIMIFQDKETGVQYVFVKNGYGGGLTPLLDSDGKPVLKK